MADDQSGKEKAPDSSKSTSEADSQKEKKKLEMNEKKSPSKKSPKMKKAKKKAAKKRSKSHEKRKEKRGGKKHRRSQEEPAATHGRAPPADADETGGESLAPCSEKEWEEEGQAAYSAALLNVKRKPNRPSVFAVPDKTKKADKDSKSPTSPQQQHQDGSAPATALRSLSPSRIKLRKAGDSKKSKDRADQIGRIVAGIVRKYLDGKNADNIQIEIKLISPDGTPTPVIP